MKILVDDLLNRPFWNRTLSEKLTILKRGKPRPKLKNLKAIKLGNDSSTTTSSEQTDKNSEICSSNFDVEIYDRVEWLTGCPTRQALFCWPCLLFKVRSCVWNKAGIKDLNEIHFKIADHQKSGAHIQAVLDLHLITEENKIEKPVNVKSADKELVKRNRDIVKRLIDVICFLCSTRKKSRTESHKNTLAVEDCLENIQFLRNFDLLHLNVIDDAITMLQVKHQIINDLVDAITSVMKMAILKETQQSTFVSMIVSEHSCNHSRSQISTVLRYLKKGEVCEMFVGFMNRSSKLTPNDIVQHISKIITEFEISRRIISYSLDGSVLLNASSFHQVKTELQCCHPYIYFVPCYYHKLDTVLQESLSTIADCDLFFKNMKSLKSCLKEESKLWQIYQDFRMVNSAPSILCFETFNSIYTAEFLNAVKTNRSSLISFFEFAVSKSENLTSSDFVQLTALKAYLDHAKTILLLEILIKLFNIIAPMTKACNGLIVPNFPFDSNLINSILDNFIGCREQEALWTQIMANTLQELEKTMDATTAVKTADQIRVNMRRQFLEIGKCMSLQFRFRIESLKSMTFFHVLNLEKSAKFLNTDYVRTVYTTYGQSIQYVTLLNEIKIVVANRSLTNIQSVHQLTKFFVVSNLIRAVPNLYRLCELVLTLPCTLPTTDCRRSSKLSEIEPWTYKSGKCEVNGDVSLMCIERDLLEEVRQKKTFYENVIDKFKEKNKYLELTYYET